MENSERGSLRLLFMPIGISAALLLAFLAS